MASGGAAAALLGLDSPFLGARISNPDSCSRRSNLQLYAAAAGDSSIPSSSSSSSMNGMSSSLSEDWRSSCAVLSSQWAAAAQGPQEDGVQPRVKSTVNTSSSSSSSSSSSAITFQDARRGSAFRETFKDLVALPKPLSIQDLSAPPAHGARLRVAYQGVPGAYSENAASKAYANCEPVPCDQFEAAFQAVELWLADRAVLPIENSLGGSIHRNYDLLLRHRLHIVGEVQLAVRHCLLALPGVRTEELTRAISHPQALAQCEHTLTRLGVAREAVDDTAGAARMIAENARAMRHTAAVASHRAAELYGLDVLAEDIQDEEGNMTRFLMLAREPIIPRTDRPFKTSVVFALEEESAGSLFKALSAFALRGINLTKIESRPQRKRPLRVVDDSNHGTAKYFEYLFYIDLEASMADPRAQNALGQLQEFASFLRVLGSYPMDMTPVFQRAAAAAAAAGDDHSDSCDGKISNGSCNGAAA